MIYYLTPFCSQKRLGHIHNQYCALVPNDDDYICILDPDVMFLHPHQQVWIEGIVANHGNNWDVLGCVTNRIGNESQRHGHPTDNQKQWVFDLTRIDVHMNICKETAYLKGSHIEETNLVAGFLMIFKKALWNKIKFQEGINFDIKFCEAVRGQGGRIGIMKGIYVFHNYRMGKDNIKDKNHLLNRVQ